MRDGEVLTADWYVTAVPFERLLDIVPTAWVDKYDYFRNLKRLETSPITSVHLWFDGPVMELPHAMLVGCVRQ
jgi:hypothetical protein